MAVTIAPTDNVVPITVASRRRELSRRISFGWVLAINLALWAALGATLYLIL